MAQRRARATALSKMFCNINSTLCSSSVGRSESIVCWVKCEQARARAYKRTRRPCFKRLLTHANEHTQSPVSQNSSESGKQCGTAINGINCSSNGVIESATARNWSEIAFARNAKMYLYSHTDSPSLSLCLSLFILYPPRFSRAYVYVAQPS